MKPTPPVSGARSRYAPVAAIVSRPSRITVPRSFFMHPSKTGVETDFVAESAEE
jgi:hypothetical protein